MFHIRIHASCAVCNNTVCYCEKIPKLCSERINPLLHVLLAISCSFCDKDWVQIASFISFCSRITIFPPSKSWWKFCNHSWSRVRMECSDEDKSCSGLFYLQNRVESRITPSVSAKLKWWSWTKDTSLRPFYGPSCFPETKIDRWRIPTIGCRLTVCSFRYEFHQDPIFQHATVTLAHHYT